MSLTAKQRLFVSAYLVDKNATQAAIAAGYSKKTATSIGQENLKKPEVAAAIESQIKAQEAATLITVQRVLQEYGRLAFFDPRNLFRADGNPKGITEIDDDTAAAIAGVKVVAIGNAEMGVGEIREYKIANKLGALDSLARHLGMFNDRMTLDASEELKELLALIAGAGNDVLSRFRHDSDDA